MNEIDFKKMNSIGEFMILCQNLNKVESLMADYPSDIKLCDLRKFLIDSKTKLMQGIAPLSKD